jgi:hypothetical protein
MKRYLLGFAFCLIATIDLYCMEADTYEEAEAVNQTPTLPGLADVINLSPRQRAEEIEEMHPTPRERDIVNYSFFSVFQEVENKGRCTPSELFLLQPWKLFELPFMVKYDALKLHDLKTRIWHLGLREDWGQEVTFRYEENVSSLQEEHCIVKILYTLNIRNYAGAEEECYDYGILHYEKNPLQKKIEKEEEAKAASQKPKGTVPISIPAPLLRTSDKKWSSAQKWGLAAGGLGALVVGGVVWYKFFHKPLALSEIP